MINIGDNPWVGFTVFSYKDSLQKKMTMLQDVWVRDEVALEIARLVHFCKAIVLQVEVELEIECYNRGRANTDRERMKKRFGELVCLKVDGLDSPKERESGLPTFTARTIIDTQSCVGWTISIDKMVDSLFNLPPFGNPYDWGNEMECFTGTMIPAFLEKILIKDNHHLDQGRSLYHQDPLR